MHLHTERLQMYVLTKETQVNGVIIPPKIDLFVELTTIPTQQIVQHQGQQVDH